MLLADLHAPPTPGGDILRRVRGHDGNLHVCVAALRLLASWTALQAEERHGGVGEEGLSLGPAVQLGAM
jgi:hypothetical protein